MKGSAGGKRAADMAGRKRTGPPEEVLRDADTVRLLADTIKRAKPALAPSKAKQIKHLVRKALRQRRLGLDRFSEGMADIAKAAGCKLRQARDNMQALEAWGAFVRHAQGGGTENATWSMDGEALFRALVACSCNPHPTLRVGLRGPERLAPPRQSTPAVTPAVEPRPTPAVGCDFSYSHHMVTPHENAVGAATCPTPAVEPDFSSQIHMVKPHENTLFPIYQSLAHADPSTCTESASGEETLLTKGTGPREEANRVEPFPFTEKPSLPPALPVQEEPDASTCVVPVAPREGCPTARALGVLHHLRVNGPATYGATASDMGISFGDAWRARDQLQRIRAIEFDCIGQMVPAPRA
jgi:hypothetical protein